MRGQLYFRRADLFDDETEGLPPKEYEHVLGLNPYDLNDIYERDHHIAFIAQFRESYYINCWYLFEDETVAMWKQYGQNGVAICSRYTLLKEVLDPITDRPHLGLVRYGSKHLTGWNTMRFITTKKEKYAHEKEVRALLWITDEHASGNRHFDENNKPHPRPLTPPPAHVLEDVKRKVNVQKLVTGCWLSRPMRIRRHWARSNKRSAMAGTRFR